jgi:hypothetical protein
MADEALRAAFGLIYRLDKFLVTKRFEVFFLKDRVVRRPGAYTRRENE